ncbi:unnamed protein product [Thelazia callipaeda]|uniref:Hexosyltransferase n=1 Tax=Thelazia callipaeda TaxID=103827 RepID=A0A158RD49_THECL|nr:unnamed protein product [Thelazia callipaeda]
MNTESNFNIQSASLLEFRYAWHKINQSAKSFRPFQYSLEPTVCKKKKRAKAALYIAISPHRNGQLVRNLIRHNWALKAKADSIEVIFSMGQIKNESELIQESYTIAQESIKFGDILMANFYDSWENLVQKWWSNNYYHSSQCSHIPFMASLDSDTLIFSEYLNKFLHTKNDILDGYVGCTVIVKQPAIRDYESKYFVSKLQWPEEELPSYCSGAMIIENFQAAGMKMQNVPGIYPWLTDDVCSSTAIAVHPIKPNRLPSVIQYSEFLQQINKA